MKWITGLILLFLVAAQSFSPWITIGQYAINKEYISKNLCINKDRPKLHCNGKCQLMKKLAEEEKQNAPAESSLGKNKTSLEWYWQDLPPQEITALAGLKTLWPSLDASSLCTSDPRSVFHPPSVQAALPA